KILLASAFEGYPDAETKADENNALTPLSRLIQERELWTVAQEEVGAHSLRYFDVFSSLIPAVRAFREPYCLKGADDFQYKLASLLYLADAMARSWKIP